MAERLHVHPKLVGAAGDRGERQTGRTLLARYDLPAGLGRAPALEIDPLARLALPVGGERQIDQPFGALHRSPDARDVALADKALLELDAEPAMHPFALGHDHHPRGVLVEPVHGARARIAR